MFLCNLMKRCVNALVSSAVGVWEHRAGFIIFCGTGLPFLSLGFKCVIEEVVFVEHSALCTAVSEILSCASSFTCFFCEQRLVFFFSRGQPLRALPKFLKI